MAKLEYNLAGIFLGLLVMFALGACSAFKFHGSGIDIDYDPKNSCSEEDSADHLCGPKDDLSKEEELAQFVTRSQDVLLEPESMQY
jgi:hypothetical protein